MATTALQTFDIGPNGELFFPETTELFEIENENECDILT